MGLAAVLKLYNQIQSTSIYLTFSKSSLQELDRMVAISQMEAQPQISRFALANSLTSHLGVHPADKALNPPDSYLFVQDALAIACGACWVIAYLFCTLRCLRDKRSGIPLYVS